MKTKAQTHIFSVILMAAIVLALVGVAYLWGVPLVEKRSTYTQYIAAEKFMSDLNDKIESIATTCTTPGGCTQSLYLPTIEGASMFVDEANNEIVFQFPSKQRMLTEGEITLNTPFTEEPADYGSAPAGILKAGSATSGGAYLIRLTLKYRELFDEETGIGFLINVSGRSSGSRQVIITYDQTRQIPGGSLTGGDLTVSLVKLNII